MTLVSRFAPSPTGQLHLGHALSALTAHDLAQAAGGRFLLRIEDIDTGRCRAEFIAGIEADLAWLGLHWEQPVRRQSDHLADYAGALDTLKQRKLVYPCFCTRADIAAQIAGSASAPHGPDGALYPGICKHLPAGLVQEKLAHGVPHAWRLHTDRAMRATGPLTWHDSVAGLQQANPALLGDVVLARKDTPTSYHLAVTVDDALQGVTHIVRGTDLFHASHIHRLLQALLGLPEPLWLHHPMVLGADGQRLAKRDDSQTLAALRAIGWTPTDVRQRLGL
jgi:glutamyl-Q tRNA(Asp) synthetase